MIEYYFAAIFVCIISIIFIINKDRWRISKSVGFLFWIILILYFPLEAIIINETTEPYHFLTQAMSELGILSCGANTYMLAPHHICSPLAPLMNIIFIVTGILIAAGAILLHRFWGDGTRTRIATGMWVVYGLGYSVSGIYPADVNFWVHMIFSLPSMFLQIPAMIIISQAIKPAMPKLSRFTFICMIISAISLILMAIGFPPGLMQRVSYGFVWIWMSAAAIVLWKRDGER